MIGLDVVDIARIELAISHAGFLKKVFSESELDYWKTKGEKAETLAGMFAAKEAAAKALGTGFRLFRPIDIEVFHTELGAPILEFRGHANEALAGRKTSVSISHTDTIAMAIVTIDG